MRALCRLLLLWLCFPVVALAAVPIGVAEVVEARAVVSSGDKPERALRQKGPVFLGDTLRAVKGNVKLRLTDGSVLMLAEGTRLTLTGEEFGSLGRAFSVRLWVGSVWARVKKAAAGSERNFEIATERAVAGVRGTEFRVDVRRLDQESYTRVSVFEGAVYVRGTIQAPRLSVAMDTDRLSSPDAERSAGPKRAARAAAVAPPAEAPPAAAPMASAPAAPPPAAPPPPPPPSAEVRPTHERVLELAAKEAVLVGPGDDWEPQRATEGRDALARFAAKHRE